MNKGLLVLAGSVALIPGVVTLQSGLGIPPEKGYNLIFGGVVEACGGILLLLLWVNRERLQGLSSKTVTRTVIALGVGFMCCLVAYLLLFHFCVVDHSPRGVVYYPLWTTGRIDVVVKATGGRWQVIEEYGRYAAYGGVKEMSPVPIFVTTTLFLVLYLGIFTTLTLAVGIVAFREGTRGNRVVRPSWQAGQ